MRIIKGSATARKSRVYAAGEDDDFSFDDMNEQYDEEESLSDAVDDVADNLEDIQDAFEDVTEDSTDISVDNNIADHYIAECSACKNVFISAVLQSDQDIDYVSGVCPICGKESDQYLRWVIKTVDTAEAPKEEQFEYREKKEDERADRTDTEGRNSFSRR